MLRSFFPLQTVRTGILAAGTGREREKVFERDASGRRTCKGKSRVPSLPPHLAIWQKHGTNGRDGRTSEKVPRFQRRARPTHAHASVDKKKQLVWPLFAERRQQNMRRDATAKRPATTLLINITNPIWRGDRGRSVVVAGGGHWQHNVIHRKTKEWQKLCMFKVTKEKKMSIRSLIDHLNELNENNLSRNRIILSW